MRTFIAGNLDDYSRRQGKLTMRGSATCKNFLEQRGKVDGHPEPAKSSLQSVHDGGNIENDGGNFATDAQLEGYSFTSSLVEGELESGVGLEATKEMPRGMDELNTDELSDSNSDLHEAI